LHKDKQSLGAAGQDRGNEHFCDGAAGFSLKRKPGEIFALHPSAGGNQFLFCFASTCDIAGTEKTGQRQ
jgi:hypothetical protein